MTRRDSSRARGASRCLSIVSGFVVGDVVSQHDASWLPGYGHSTAANGGDPLALVVGIVAALVLWKVGDALTR